MLKNTLTMALQHKFRVAALEWVNYLHFHKNAVPEEMITINSSGTKLIDLYGAANKFFLRQVTCMYTLQCHSECSIAKCRMRINTQEITGYAIYHLLSVIVNISNHFACILLRPGTRTKEYFLCDDSQERREWTDPDPYTKLQDPYTKLQ
uniref:Uncharacterized protein n=1 Tax=Romanomermis culicivorax TaxID=13658 RepID=A0A915JPF0_ROMCU